MLDISDLRCRPLPPAMVVKDALTGVNPYSDENYMLEFVNASQYFLQKSKGQNYRHPEQESHGEPDCISDLYQMDNKLMETRSTMEYNSQFALKHHYENGVVYTSVSLQKPKHEIKRMCIIPSLSSVSKEDFTLLETSGKYVRTAKRDLAALKKVLNTKKNLLYFYPYQFYYLSDSKENPGIEGILEVLNANFSGAFQYRETVVPDLDTYLSFIYLKNYILPDGQTEGAQ